jgi:tetraacyldisaccharide 4'-kinase
MNPLSGVFASGVALRNALYDAGVFKVQKLSRPVVNVGNISVGGSGKTPFVIALGELLKARGITFDVLSRGYGRSSKDVAIVDPQGAPDQFGDEPLLIAHKLGVPVVVAADRCQAGVLAEQRFASQLHLLDDGFQHRRLHRDFDIVMLSASDLSDTLLPVGRLREPLSALRRADVIVPASDAIAPGWVAMQWRVRREMLLDPPRLNAVAFCGLGRPQQFFNMLRSSGADLCATVAFRDHHRYTEAEIERLLKIKAKKRAQCFVTTEKDEINLGPLAGRLLPLRIAKLRLVLEDAEAAMDHLIRALEQRCGCRF